jgi:hypothetical protein
MARRSEGDDDGIDLHQRAPAFLHATSKDALVVAVALDRTATTRRAARFCRDTRKFPVLCWDIKE